MKKTPETPTKDISVPVSALLYSGLFISGGVLCLLGDTLTGAASFALGAVFSSINTPWSAMPTWAQVTITLSTIFGIVCLGIAIFTAG